MWRRRRGREWGRGDEGGEEDGGNGWGGEGSCRFLGAGKRRDRGKFCEASERASEH